MMKTGLYYLLSAAVIAVTLVGCSNPSSSGPAGQLSGMISGAAGENLELQTIEGGKLVTLESTTVGEDGSFTITPSPGLPQLDYYFLSLGSNNQVSFIADSTQSIQFKLDGENMRIMPQATGSPQTSQLYGLMKDMGPLVAQVNEKAALTRDTQASTEARQQAQEEYKTLRAELRKVCGKFVRNSPSSPAALEALSGLDIVTSMESYKTVLTSLKADFSHSTRYQLVNTQVNKAQLQLAAKSQQSAAGSSPKVGEVAPDIVMENLAGETYKLSDLRGKVVLLDFWASWCGPCRRENPNVVKAYAEYKDKGFEVFSVSLDSKKDRWEKAIAQDKLTWPYHVSDLKGWKNAAAALYDVHSIPATFLLDKEGRVVGTKLRGPALERKLEELLNS